MVGNNHIYAFVPEGFDLLVGNDPVINGNYQSGRKIGVGRACKHHTGEDIGQRSVGEAVAVASAIGDKGECASFGAFGEAGESSPHNGGGGDAVGVVVAVNEDVATYFEMLIDESLSLVEITFY